MSNFDHLNKLNTNILDSYRNIYALRQQKIEEQKKINIVGNNLTTYILDKTLSYNQLSRKIREIEDEINNKKSKLSQSSEESNQQSWTFLDVLLIFLLVFVIYQIYGRITIFLKEAILNLNILFGDFSIGNLSKFNMKYIESHPVSMIIIPAIILIIIIFGCFVQKVEKTLNSELDDLMEIKGLYKEAIEYMDESYKNQIFSYTEKIKDIDNKIKDTYAELYIVAKIPEDMRYESFVDFIFDKCDTNHFRSIEEYIKAYKRKCQAEAEAFENKMRLQELQEEREYRDLVSSYRQHNKKLVNYENRLYGDWEMIYDDDGDYIEENYGSNGVGYGGSRRKIVERDINGRWVKDEYGQIHIKSQPYDTED